jgi:CheY-like chemotaxis protein
MRPHFENSLIVVLLGESICLSDEFLGDPIPFSSEETISKQPQPARPRVLVVDDEHRIVDTITEILEGAGFHVLPAYDGWAALEAAARFRPDYLLSDVLMPRMNGVELAIAIQKMHPAARILLFSGQAGISEILLKGQQQGLEFELIAKPLHPLKLIQILKEQK